MQNAKWFSPPRRQEAPERPVSAPADGPEMRTRVKICGITRTEDAALAVELGADALGFVFAESPRRVSPEKVREILGALPGLPSVTPVGVFVNESPERIWEIVAECGLRAVQLHGDESPEVAEELAGVRHRASGIPVIKAIRVRDGSSLDTLTSCPASAFLLDAYSPEAYGGTGQRFDWDLARQAVATGRQIVLSGGLTPETVGEAIRTVRPFGVDVSSGVEVAPGRKDPAKLRAFFEAVREADA